MTGRSTPHSALRTPHSPRSQSALSIAEVVFNIPLERSFHYLIPPVLQGVLQPGMRVAAPFGARERIGCVTKRVASSPVRELKTIRRLLDPMPVIADERWALATWLARYYVCSLGETLAAMVPSQLRLTQATLHTLRARALNPEPRATEGSETVSPVSLTAHQQQALKVILEECDAARGRTLLLHGVTGSGKTELYLRAIAHVMSQGRSAICLVPEIALTPQTIDRFRERFGDGVGVWHSRLTAKQRAQEWSRAAAGACRIIVGARSAVFAPVQALGLIILDEEHESTFKQEGVPRYHAREVAQARARLAGATVVLGSATPSVESYYAAGRSGGRLLHLPDRVRGRAMPKVDIIDMREELSHRHRAAPLSMLLQRALQQTVERGEQAMLLLNRRGFARVAQCQTCGTVVRCQRCSVPLIYHADRRELVCHYCSAHLVPAELCAECRKGYLRFRGAGTERVESELHRLFPVASIARMDRDTMGRRDSHRELYDALKQRQVGLLIGTQMIAKGFDFPQVTLVGVVSADTALNLPDFRAGERTFDLLTQMAGRAGRGDLPGQVLIQTYYPTHYAIQAAQRHDYRCFYEEEIRMRRRLKLPPCSHLIELTLIGSSSQRAHECAEALARALASAARPHTNNVGVGVKLLGPAPHRVFRVRGTYRVSLMLQGRSAESMGELLRHVLQPGRRFRGMPVLVNVDPL